MNSKRSLLQFYKKCVEKGYTDMSNDTQRLDAKVVAADFQIKYKDIGKLFDEAKAEAEREMVDGQLLASVEGGKTGLKVYLRPDGSVYSTWNDGDKIEGAPTITVQKGGTLSYTYNPAKAIYTSATVGGITTGGVEYTKASYSEKVLGSGKGYIEISLDGKTLTANTISFPPFIRERFRRDDAFQRFAGAAGGISCRKTGLYMDSALNSLSNLDYRQQMTLLTQAADEERRPYSECVQIADLLGRVVNVNFPPSDEEVYDRALALLRSNEPSQINQAEKLLLSMPDYKDAAEIIYRRAVELSSSSASDELTHAVELFDSLADYKDSRSRVSDLNIKIETAVHEEKKAALLKKEARAKRGKKLAVGVAAAAAVLVIGAVVFSKAVIPAIHYKNAEELLAAGDYNGAIAAFEAIGDYKDAAELAQDTIFVRDYEAAESLESQGAAAEAAIAFGKISDYKDSKQRSFALWNDIADRKTLAAGDEHTVALKNDGTVVAAGSDYKGCTDVSGWSDIIAVSAGGYNTAGLKADGTVIATSQTNDYVKDWTNIVSVSAGSERVAGLKCDGTVVLTNDYNGRIDVSNWTDIIAVSVSTSAVLGLKADGTVLIAGSTWRAEEEITGQWSDICSLACGISDLVGLKTDGTVVAVVGRNSIHDWENIRSISAGGSRIIGVTTSGTVIAYGDSGFGTDAVEDWSDIVSAASGWFHAVGLKSDGTVVAVGDDLYGQCDVGDWTDIKIPDSK